MHHVVLLGDSIFDNAAYVAPGPDVITQLRAELPSPSKATLLAVDGAVVLDVTRQLARLPDDTTDIVLSVGGNDALRHIDLLDRRASSGAEVLAWFAEAIEAFAARYRKLLQQIAEHTLVRDGKARVMVCSIYNGNLAADMAHAASAAIAMFDDVIARAARTHAWPVIELRELFTSPADYANPIEPSTRGGAKLAKVISGVVCRMDAPHPGRAPRFIPAAPGPSRRETYPGR